MKKCITVSLAVLMICAVGATAFAAANPITDDVTRIEVHATHYTTVEQVERLEEPQAQADKQEAFTENLSPLVAANPTGDDLIRVEVHATHYTIVEQVERLEEPQAQADKQQASTENLSLSEPAAGDVIYHPEGSAVWNETQAAIAKQRAFLETLPLSELELVPGSVAPVVNNPDSKYGAWATWLGSNGGIFNENGIFIGGWELTDQGDWIITVIERNINGGWTGRQYRVPNEMMGEFQSTR